MRIRTLVLAALAALALPAAAADRIPIANEGAISDHWSPVPGTILVPAYPEAYASHQEKVCLTIGYLLNADGHTSDFALLKSWSSGSNSRSKGKFWETFAGDSSQALAHWQFAPKPDVATPGPVYTAATFVFGPDSTETRTHCAISDLTTRLVELRYDPRAGRMMSRGIFAQLDIDPNVEERLRQQLMRVREDTEARHMNDRAVPKSQPQSPPPSK